MNQISSCRLHRVYENYKDNILRFAKINLSDQSLADDVVQEAFKKLIIHLETTGKVPDEQHMKALLINMTRQVIIDVTRKRKKKKEVAIVQDWDFEGSTDIEGEVIQKEQVAIIYDRLRKELHEEHIDMLLMKYCYGYSSKEIAKKYEIKENNVNQILYRVCNKAKRLLGSGDGKARDKK